MSFIAVEEAIVARLEETLGTLVRKVYTAGGLADVEEEKQQSPGVMVSYEGIVPVPSQNSDLGNGKIQLTEKQWLTVVHVRNARGHRTHEGAKEEASPIIDGVMTSLMGWRPPVEGEGTLRLAASPGAGYTDAGFAYFPIVFTNRRTYRGID